MKKFFLCVCLLLFASPAPAADFDRPDPKLTPGEATNPPTSLAVLCRPGYAAMVRHVSNTTKERVFAEYGFDLKTIKRTDFEIDHLIPLSLDGTNSIANLWPQSYVTEPYNAHRKDVLEDRLHRLVCGHKLDLPAAQNAIAADWIGAYDAYVNHPTPSFPP